MAYAFWMQWVKRAGCSGIAFSCLVLALCAGCGRSTTAEKPGDKKAAAGAVAKTTDSDATAKDKPDKKTAAVETGVSLPDQFPKDVAVYPKAAVESSVTIEKTMSISLKTIDSAKEVETFYKEKMKFAGWEMKNSMNLPKEVMLNAEKGGRTLTILIVSESDYTKIVISIVSEK